MFRRDGDVFLLGTAMAAQLLQNQSPNPEGFRAPPGAPSPLSDRAESERRSEQETAPRFKLACNGPNLPIVDRSGTALQFSKSGKRAFRTVVISGSFKRDVRRAWIRVDRQGKFFAQRRTQIVDRAVDFVRCVFGNDRRGHSPTLIRKALDS